jgi:hypothetical protein
MPATTQAIENRCGDWHCSHLVQTVQIFCEIQTLNAEVEETLVFFLKSIRGQSALEDAANEVSSLGNRPDLPLELQRMPIAVAGCKDPTSAAAGDDMIYLHHEAVR